MSLLNLLRRVRIRGLTEGKVQKGRVEVNPLDVRDNVERFQDYGFTAQPVDGEGLRLEVGGHTIILRMDRLSERPTLGAHEVCVWHKDGHKITLKNSGLVQIDCTRLVVNASQEVVFNTPKVSGSTLIEAPTISGPTDVLFAGKSTKNHVHDGVAVGLASTNDPV